MLNRSVQPVIHSRPEATCCAIAFKKVVCAELARVASSVCDVSFKALGTIISFSWLSAESESLWDLSAF